jgi:hypothetical protein
VVVLVFVFAAVVLLHDWQMRRLHTKVIEKDTFQRHCFRVFPQARSAHKPASKTRMFQENCLRRFRQRTLMDFVSDQNNSKESSRPIAELFPEATVPFADIAGFTA